MTLAYNEKLIQAVSPRALDVERAFDRLNGETSLIITIALANESKLLGFYPVDFEPDIENIAKQVIDLEAKGEQGAIYILSGSTHIPPRAFINGYGSFKDKIKEIFIPQSVTKIGYYAFFLCNNLKKIIFSEGLKEIGNHAFSSCISLEKVDLPQSLMSIGEEAFRGCKNLRNLTLPSNIQIIGPNAFLECDLKDLSFENKYWLLDQGLVIDKRELHLNGVYRNGLQSVNIPEGIVEIGKYTFCQCTALQKVLIPQSVTQIGEFAFCECKALKKITIPEGVTRIQKFTFKECYSLESVSLPENVTEINNFAFIFCKSLKSIILPSKVSKIGFSVFGHCDSLGEVTILNPDILNLRGAWDAGAFNECYNLRTVNLPKGITWSRVKRKFKDSPFGNKNPNPSRATVKKEKLKKIAEATIEILAKTACGDPEAIVDQQKNKITIRAKLSKGGALYAEIPRREDSEINDINHINFEPLQKAVAAAPEGALVILGIKEIKNRMFYQRKDFSSVIFPKDLTKIGLMAFASCSSLKSVTIPKGVTTLGVGAFFDCSSLESVILPPDLKNIEDALFCECSSLSKINIPSALESIKAASLRGCNLGGFSFENENWLLKNGLVINKDKKEVVGTSTRDFEEVTLPSWITTIGTEAFSLCQTLKHITLPDSITEIGPEAFKGCSSLKSISIAEGVTKINESTFQDCTALENVQLPETLTHIGNSAFFNCSSLINIELPQSMFLIGESAFSRCSSLKRITLHESVIKIGPDAFSHCTSLEDLSLLSWTTEIQELTFEDCTSLKSVCIPHTVNEIKYRAFYNTGITKLTFSGAVRKIEAEAFANCRSLRQVDILDIIPLRFWDISSFRGCTALTKVKMPSDYTWEWIRKKFWDCPFGQRNQQSNYSDKE